MEDNLSNYAIWRSYSELISEHEKIAQGLTYSEAEIIQNKFQSKADTEYIYHRIKSPNENAAPYDFYIRQDKEPTYIIWCKSSGEHSDEPPDLTLVKLFYTKKLAEEFTKKQQYLADKHIKNGTKLEFYIEMRDDSEDRGEVDDFDSVRIRLQLLLNLAAAIDAVDEEPLELTDDEDIHDLD